MGRTGRHSPNSAQPLLSDLGEKAEKKDERGEVKRGREDGRKGGKGGRELVVRTDRTSGPSEASSRILWRTSGLRSSAIISGRSS
eukprot:COSAG04_NODE_11839_length_685_cov_0.873720_1_plen_85_part_00